MTCIKISYKLSQLNKNGKVNLILFHPTGLSKECWIPTISHLPSNSPIDKILIVDARNHGDSQLLNKCKGDFDWNSVAFDVLKLLDRLNWDKLGHYDIDLSKPIFKRFKSDKPLVFIGHSFGGNNAVLINLLKPISIGMILIEPIIMSREVLEMMKRNYGNVPDPMVIGASKRRNGFSSFYEAKTSFLEKSFFKSWTEDNLKAYVYGAMYENNDKVWLKCPPDQEAATFSNANIIGPTVFSRLGEINQPTLILSGEFTSMKSFMYPMSHNRLVFKDEAITEMIPNAKHEYLKGVGHMCPQEDSLQVSKKIIEFINDLIDKDQVLARL